MISLTEISKSYGKHLAVDNLSFQAEKGRIFGLLGPNGAGKSTTIKMIMNILCPDVGSISFNGKKLRQKDTDRIGYLPEERGIYKKVTVREFITYFGMLKGKSRQELSPQIDKWLNWFNLKEWENKKTEELSKGMSQKIQFITSIIHDPDILILDEPFSGLDPVSMESLKEAVLELRDEGKTILFSTHVMDQAEKICSDIIILNKGKAVIQGSVTDVKRSFGNCSVHLEFEGDGSFIESAEEVKSVMLYPRFAEVELCSEEMADSFLKKAAERVSVKRYERVEPSLHKIFVKTVGGDDNE